MMYHRFLTLLLLPLINSGTSNAKSCGDHLDECFDHKDCCSGMICDSSVKSLPSVCRYEPNEAKDTLRKVEVGKTNDERVSENMVKLKIASKEKQQSSPLCMENLEVCTHDSDCCDDLTCDRSISSSLGSRCRHTIAAYARRKLDEVCKNNLDKCSSDNECCKDMICDTSLPGLGYRCRSDPKKGAYPVKSKAGENPRTSQIKTETKCLDHLSICNSDSECCSDMLCDSSISTSLGSRCRFISPVGRGELSDSKPKPQIGTELTRMNRPVSSTSTTKAPPKTDKTMNIPQKSQNNGMCLSWRQDCTSNQNACCEGLTCSTFNKNNLNMQCHFVSYEVKIKY